VAKEKNCHKDTKAQRKQTTLLFEMGQIEKVKILRVSVP